MNKKNNKGFSLIELIIAIAILVILTGLLAPQFMKYIEKSREAKDMQTLDSIYSAVQGAMADEKLYKEISDAVVANENEYMGGKALNTLGDTAFRAELQELLGTADLTGIALNSKKATGGNLLVSIDAISDPSQMKIKVFYGNVGTGGKVGTTIGGLEVGGE